MMKYVVVDTAKNLKLACDYFAEHVNTDLRDTDSIGVDCETKDLDPWKGELRLIQLSDGDKTVIIDVRNLLKNEGRNRFGREENYDLFLPLKELLENPAIAVVIHNSQFEQEWLIYWCGISPNRVFDTFLASKNIDYNSENDPLKAHGLAPVTRRFLGIDLDKTEQKSDWGREILTKEQLDYAALDVYYSPKLREVMYEALAADKLLEAALIDFECVPSFAKMRIRGHCVDRKLYEKEIKRLEELRGIASKKLQEVVRPTTGIDIIQPTMFDVPEKDYGDVLLSSHSQILEALKRLGVPVFAASETEEIAKAERKGIRFAIGTGKKNVAHLASSYPVVKLLNDFRGLEKQVDSFGPSFLKFLTPDGQGYERIHSHIKVFGAESGRTSCVPMDTKALTRSGWKSYDELVVGEEILAYDQETKMQVWTPLLAKNKFFNAEVGSIGTDFRRFRCTANHKWVVLKGHGWVAQDKQPHPSKESLVEAKDIKFGHRIVTNAPYTQTTTVDIDIFDTQKYATNYDELITKMSKNQLDAFVLGFLLADGHNNSPTKIGTRRGWQWTQAKTVTREQLLTATYLQHSGRIGVGKHYISTKETQNSSDRVTMCISPYTAVNKTWEYESTEDVWCPTTKYGTWVMRQGDLITITGNSEKPNMQQIPDLDLYIGTEKYHVQFRQAFIVPKGYKLINADYSGIELRIMAEFSQDPVFVEAFQNGKDLHAATASMIFKVPYEDCLEGGPHYKTHRYFAKRVNFGIAYGQGYIGLAQILLIPEEEAQEIIEAHKSAHPVLWKWLDSQANRAIKTLRIRSASGRMQRFLPPTLVNGMPDRKEVGQIGRNGKNMPAQGTSADITKLAMTLVDRALMPYDAHIINTVHDEISVEARDDEKLPEVKYLLEENMRQAAQRYIHSIPVQVDAKIIENWGQK